MNKQQLIQQIKKKKSLLCIGLDTDLEKIPEHLLQSEDPLFEFNKAIIDATNEFAVAYKPNTAFYEAYGIKGFQSLQKTIDYLNQNYPEVFTIADAKRGDIGNTSTRYAKAFFEEFNFDSITVAPYMGSDSVKPFLEFENKWVILLGLTSNTGAEDFQLGYMHNYQGVPHKQWFQEVLETSKSWGTDENMMYVVGATKAEYFKKVRNIVPNHFLLVPGVGAQGGSLEGVIENGLGKEPNILINSSRGIIYAGEDVNYAERAAEQAQQLQTKMGQYL